MSTYQERYIEHQARKKAQLLHGAGEEPRKIPYGVLQALEARRSQRLFVDREIEPDVLLRLYKVATLAPSSCNRHGVRLSTYTSRYKKNVLSGLLVGGTGWAHRAGVIVLLLADPVAYASPNEKDFMHYLDAGFLAMTLWLASEQEGLGCAYINPNVADKGLMHGFVGDHIFCGALAIGYYDTRVHEAPRVSYEDMFASKSHTS